MFRGNDVKVTNRRHEGEQVSFLEIQLGYLRVYKVRRSKQEIFQIESTNSTSR